MQDSYAFTKAMGEMLVREVQEQHNLPVLILRPSIIESAVCDPCPGWIEGLRMIDPLIMAYGKGLLIGFPGTRSGSNVQQTLKRI